MCIFGVSVVASAELVTSIVLLCRVLVLFVLVCWICYRVVGCLVLMFVLLADRATSA